MPHLTFGTKAETLERLSTRVTTAKCAPLVWFTVSQWDTERAATISRIVTTLHSAHLIIRSSARQEDSAQSSLAGAFDSVANVDPNDQAKIEQAVECVIASYGSRHPDDQVIAQEQLCDVAASGVIFTRDLSTFAPYYVVNFDAKSGSTSSVTAGSSNELQTYYRFRKCSDAPPNQILAQAIALAQELETLLQSDAIDIEFACTNTGEVYLLQARPLVDSGTQQKEVDDTTLFEALFRLHRKIQKWNGPHPGLHGRKAIYSVMTDWNPAEIIGERPRPLALTLYKRFVTDAIWAYQRKNYGYKDLRGFPLMLSFLGLPYIDVRVSFNSFVPFSLDPSLADKLVDYYIDRLLETPTDHDKVEFNIIFSCYYLNVAERLKHLSEHGFTDLEIDRIKFALLTLTNKVIASRDGLYQTDFDRIRELGRRYDRTMSSDMPVVDKIYWLTEDCQRYGTLPFAGLARAGFIAMQFLRSLVELRIFTEEDRLRYLNSLNTVARQLTVDTHAMQTGALSRDEFLHRYGHLRPGTYDILSPSYGEAFELYFGSHSASPGHAAAEPFELSESQRRAIESQLIENGIEASVDSLFSFIKDAIEGREYSKFVFTRSLSKVIELIGTLGESCSLSKEELSYLDISTVLDLYANLTPHKLRDILYRSIEINRATAQITQMVRLPQLITTPEQVYSFLLSEVAPNFITQKRVTKIVIAEEDLMNHDLADKIVFIRSADPGYDWLFSRQISGLITMYGGANSHMAIRCAELGIAAVIGCGEKNFTTWSQATKIELDCSNRVVAVVA